MQNDLRARVFNIQRYSVDDGAGIRTCVFLKGCPLRCAWCHNPESQSFAMEISCNPNACISCGACARVCPSGAHRIADGHSFVRENCIRCGKCAQACPTGSLEIVGTQMTVDEVLKRALRDRVFYGENGGVTITGGEPMAQPEFTLALARAAKAAGVSVAVETSGFGRTEDFLALIPWCDQFLFDCKAASEDHERLTGVSDRQILKNLFAIGGQGAHIVLRCPVVKGGNLNGAFAEKIIQLANACPGIEAVELLPYHATGLGKAGSIGMAAQQRFETPSADEMAALATQLKRHTQVKVLGLRE